MKTVGLLLLSLLVGLSTGHLDKCFKCHARNSEYCKGVPVLCPKDSSCMTIYEKVGCNQTYYSIEKRCTNNLLCNISMYGYANDIAFYELSRQCCKGELCNNGAYSVPNITYNYDGPECPYCSSFEILEKCKPVGNTICRSSTDQCGYLVGWLNKPDGGRTKFSAQGCISELACKYDYSHTVGYFMDGIVAKGCWLPKTDNNTSNEESKGL